jgi:hypothetical protein
MDDIINKEYWVKKASKETVKMMEDIFKSLDEITKGYSLRYQKPSYIGIEINSKVNNFISFRPLKRDFNKISFRLEKTNPIDEKIKNSGIENYTYNQKRYHLKIKESNIELVKTLADIAKT